MATLLGFSLSTACVMGSLLAACSSSDKNTAGATNGVVDGIDAGGAVKLEDCDQHNETSAKPITQACGSFTTAAGSQAGTRVELGQYGASMDVNVGAGFENTDPMDDVK